MNLRNLSFVLVLLVFTVWGCSMGESNPINTGLGNDSGMYPIDEYVPISEQTGESGSGILGAFALDVDTQSVQAVLSQIRMAAIGESYVVSGLSYFSILPCTDCLKISSIGLDGEGNIVMGFSIKHPYEKGNPAEPPSAKNRLDLDIFDVALIFEPVGVTSELFDLTGVGAFTKSMINSDGYTGDLSSIAESDNLMPYKICYESEDNNRFEMGTESQEFDVIIADPGGQFNLYLTMGFGLSTNTWQDRLNPIYYVPEFNRKAAWKVEVISEPWQGSDPSTVTIDIYDWNHGSEIAVTYPDPLNTDHIRASSEVESVSVEVPGMTDLVVEAVTSDLTSNGWDDPLTYTASFSNENGIGEGDYTGLVKVLDSRVPGIVVLGGETDTFVHVPDGVNKEWHSLIEFATYQTFIATILPDGPETGWAVIWGKPELAAEGFCFTSEMVYDDFGNIYVAGYYVDTVDFDPSDGVEERMSIDGKADSFLSKFDRNGNFQWVKTWGGGRFMTTPDGLGVDSSGNIYVTGTFDGTVDFDPGSGEEIRTYASLSDLYLSKFDSNGDFQWVYTRGVDNTNVGFGIDFDDNDNVLVTGIGSHMFLGKVSPDGNVLWIRDWAPAASVVWSALDVVVDSFGDIYVTGGWGGECDFDPGPGDATRESVGFSDAYLSRFDSQGIFDNVQTWGSLSGSAVYPEEGRGLSMDPNGNIYVTGHVEGMTDFDPGSGVDEHGADLSDNTFLSKFDLNGNYQWARTWTAETFVTTDQDVVCDSAGDIYIASSFKGTVDFDPGTEVVEYTASAMSMYDMYLSKFDTSGDFIWVRVWGSDGNDFGFGASTDGLNNIYMTGEFGGAMDFDPGTGIDERTPTGGGAAYLLKVLPNGYWE